MNPNNPPRPRIHQLWRVVPEVGRTMGLWRRLHCEFSTWECLSRRRRYQGHLIGILHPLRRLQSSAVVE